MNRLIVLLLAVAVGACATRPHTYSPPTDVYVRESTNEVKQKITEARKTSEEAKTLVVEAQKQTDEVASISINAGSDLDKIIQIAPDYIQGQLASVKTQMDDLKTREVTLTQTLQSTFDKHDALGKQLEETSATLAELEKRQIEYHTEAQLLADDASKENAYRVKAEKSLSWYRWHWWGSWIAFGAGVVLIIFLGILKLTGRLALTGATI